MAARLSGSGLIFILIGINTQFVCTPNKTAESLTNASETAWDQSAFDVSGICAAHS